MKRLLLLLTFGLLALLLPTAVSASVDEWAAETFTALDIPLAAQGDGHDRLVGYGEIDAPPFSGDQFVVAAQSGPLGEDPSGVVILRTATPDPTRPTTYRGDVSLGCFFAVGNRAVAVGLLPESQRFFVPEAGRTVAYAAVIAEDNGNPVGGQPLDRAFPVLLFEATGERVCAGGAFNPALAPIDRGNVIVEDALP